ncbi:MAG TPA: hypothetical protein VF826_18385 [Chloroflexia bacterium]|jgi:hypothetical protein
MTRILYWNIQDFSINKILNPVTNKRKRGSAVSEHAASLDRRQLILQNLTENTPQIFVVVEVSTAAGAAGSVITGGGANGTWKLLEEMRAAAALAPPPLAEWCVVPPLTSGTGGFAEGIAVFYDASALHFVGPYKWPGAGPAVPMTAAGAATDYLPPFFNPLRIGVFANALPNRTVPLASPLNGGAQESHLAGQFQFLPAAGGGPLQFPGPNNRTPFLTAFYDPVGARIITLLAMHTTPAVAAGGMTALGNVTEMTSAPLLAGGPEVQVVVGDFNVSLWAAGAGAAYGTLTAPAPGPGYAQAITLGTYAGGNVPPDNGYFITHIKPGNNAKPWVGAYQGNNFGYPGYDYMGSAPMFPGYDAIDNIFYRYIGTPPPAAHNTTIVNRVVGSPYNNPDRLPLPVGLPQGALGYLASAPPPVPVPAAGPPVTQGGYAPGTVGGLKSFKGWNKYGKIRSTSDHLAIVIDV